MFRFLDPIFRALSDGRIIRTTVATALRIFAVLSLVLGLVVCALILKAVSDTKDMGAIAGSLLLAGFWFISSVLQCAIMLYRAGTISQLGETQFTVTSIVSVLFRMMGESAMATWTLVGIGGGLFMMIANANPAAVLGSAAALLPFASLGSAGPAGGVIFAVILVVMAFVALLFFYFLAELTLVLVDIANNTHAMRLSLGFAPPQSAAMAAAVASVPQWTPPPAAQYVPPAQPSYTQPMPAQPFQAQPSPAATRPVQQWSPPPAASYAPPAAMPARQTVTCPRCQNAIEAGMGFCNACGAPAPR